MLTVNVNAMDAMLDESNSILCRPRRREYVAHVVSVTSSASFKYDGSESTMDCLNEVSAEVS